MASLNSPSGEPWNPNDFVLTSSSSALSPYTVIATTSINNAHITDNLTITQTNNSGTVVIGSAYGGTYSTTPITVSSGGYIYAEPSPADEMKSKPVVTEKHSHDIQCRLRVEATKVISEYFCHHCQEVLHSKVISRIPKSIIKKQCLSRIVKGV